MDTDICTKLLEESLSNSTSNVLITFLSTVLGAVVGGAISFFTARYVLQRNQQAEKMVRLYSLVIEVESQAKEMLFISYKVAGVIKNNIGNLEEPGIMSELRELTSQFWVASNKCREIIDRNFPSMTRNHEFLLEKLRLFPDLIGYFPEDEAKTIFEDKYNLDTFNDLSLSLKRFGKYLFEDPIVKQAYSESYGI